MSATVSSTVQAIVTSTPKYMYAAAPPVPVEDLPAYLDGQPIIYLTYTFLALCLIIMVPSTFLFVLRIPRDQHIRHRSVFLTLVSAACSLVVAPVFLLSSVRLIPCFINLWVSYIAIPLWTASFLLRAWRLVILSDVQRTIASMQRYAISAKSAGFVVGARDIGGDFWRGITRHRRRATEFRILLICSGIMSYFALNLILIQCFADHPFLPTDPIQGCAANWVYIPLYTSLCLAVFFIAPYVIWRLQRTPEDDYGIRRDLLFTASVAAVAFPTFLVLSFVRIKDMELHFPPLLVVTLILLAGHVTSVLIPAWKSWRTEWRAASSASAAKTSSSSSAGPISEKAVVNTREAFAHALEDDDLFEHLERIAVANFCAENTYFLRAMKDLRSGTGNSELATSIYQNFLHESAPLELNVRPLAREMAKRRLDDGIRGPEVFMEVQEEVEHMIYTNIFPKLTDSCR